MAEAGSVRRRRVRGPGDHGDGLALAGTETDRVVEAVWRIESSRLIGALARVVGDLGLAEDLAQDALLAALQQWPTEGVPARPGAWLMSTAKHRAIDSARRGQRLGAKLEDLGRATSAETDIDAAIDEGDVGDDLLRLIFTACHPVIPTSARAALVLRALGGLTTVEIARAFLVPVSTVAQRIVRAKRALAERRVPFEVPDASERVARLGSVLEIIYLIFNEGYAATSGDEWMRPALCDEAVRLGRVVAELMPDEPEVHGLVALMELQSSRLRARVGPAGQPILLLDQDRGRWDQLLIGRGLAALERADAGGTAVGSYALQARIAACHSRARTAAETDWPRIAALYGALAVLTPSPVIELNRAMAVAMALGPLAGLELIDALAHEPALQAYHLYPSARGDLLAKVGRREEARAEFERAAGLTTNEREKTLLLGRAAALAELDGNQ